MAQSTSGTSSRRHPNTRDHDTASLASSRFATTDTEWEASEAVRQRELEEARARAAQMEKTMRWWSDCTANWREKWSKVRTERNKAREESKQLRSKLEAAMKDASGYKRERQQLELANDKLQKEVEKIHILLLKHAGQFEGPLLDALGDDPMKDFSFSVTNNEQSPTKGQLNNGTIECDSTDGNIEEYILQGAVPKSKTNEIEWNGIEKIDKPADTALEEEYIIQKVSMLQLRLDETTKTLHIERDEKTQLHRSIEKLTGDLQELKEKNEELREARQDAVRELLTVQDQHQEEVRLIRSDLIDEANSRDGMDRRINDLRAELERLQAENAAEWGKRERLETEKLALERDNKKLRAELRDLHERMERKGRPLTNSDAELRHLQQELVDKNKEITDLKHSQNKLKKMMQDKMTELAHSVRRAEQYEAEVKKLRVRVEELKRDLSVAEDEIDTATNNIRKLQRTNDDLQEQVDNFQVQLQHLHSSEGNEDGGEEMAHLDEEETDIIT